MSAPVDVLAVVDYAIRVIDLNARDEGEQADDLREARATVAELIKAAQSLLHREEFRQGADAGNDALVRKLRDALARCGGAK